MLVNIFLESAHGHCCWANEIKLPPHRLFNIILASYEKNVQINCFLSYPQAADLFKSCKSKWFLMRKKSC